MLKTSRKSQSGRNSREIVPQTRSGESQHPAPHWLFSSSDHTALGDPFKRHEYEMGAGTHFATPAFRFSTSSAVHRRFRDTSPLLFSCSIRSPLAAPPLPPPPSRSFGLKDAPTEGLAKRSAGLAWPLDIAESPPSSSSSVLHCQMQKASQSSDIVPSQNMQREIRRMRASSDFVRRPGIYLADPTGVIWIKVYGFLLLLAGRGCLDSVGESHRNHACCRPAHIIKGVLHRRPQRSTRLSQSPDDVPCARRNRRRVLSRQSIPAQAWGSCRRRHGSLHAPGPMPGRLLCGTGSGAS